MSTGPAHASTLSFAVWSFTTAKYTSSSVGGIGTAPYTGTSRRRQRGDDEWDHRPVVHRHGARRCRSLAPLSTPRGAASIATRASSARAAEVERRRRGPSRSRRRDRRRTERVQVPAVEHRHAVREASGLAEEVRAQHDRAAVLGRERADEVDDVTRASGSRPDVGSSRNSTSGSCSSARASATRLRWPVEKPWTRWSARSAMPNRSSIAVAFAPASSLGHAPDPAGDDEVLPRGQPIVEPRVLGQHAGAATHLVAVHCRVDAEHAAAPPVGARTPLSRRTVVVLPAPFGPSTASTSPGWASNERSTRAS